MQESQDFQNEKVHKTQSVHKVLINSLRKVMMFT
jgi:hypothetical protein